MISSLFSVIKKGKYLFGFLLITLLMGALFIHPHQAVEEEKIVKNFKPVLRANSNSGVIESPELILVNENNIYPATPPVTVEPQVLGSIVGESNQGKSSPSHTRKRITEYVIKEGDTLSSIAEKFGISVNTILWANDISKNSTLTPGERLTILPVDGVMHLVKRGETVSGIAAKYNIESDKISSFNELEDKGEIYKGDILILPGAEQIQKRYYASSQSSNVPNSYFILPTTGKITQKRHFYNAVDVANNCGTPVVAAAGGRVIEVRYNSWPAGNYVKVEHYNGLITMYAHLSRINVTTGNSVSQGEQIGYMGTTGLTTGCHLHFDLLSNTTVNPLSKYQLGSYISW